MSARDLAYQITKYNQRGGWSHRDLLRLSHAKTSDKALNDVLHYAVKGWQGIGEAVPTEAHLRYLWAVEKAKRADNAKEIVDLIREFDIPRECIPTQHLKNPAVWEALLERMPMTAMIRNLATMSRVGLLAPMSQASKTVVERLGNQELLQKARIHPIQVLSALRVYSAGGKPGAYSRSHNTERFDVEGPIVAALEKAFTLSFGNVEPTGKRTMLAFDVSGSMQTGEIAGIPGLTPAEAEAAIGMTIARTEWSQGAVAYPLYHAVAFTGDLKTISLSPTESFKSIAAKMNGNTYSGTNCALAFKYARERKLPIDTFVTMTDNESWVGSHPKVELEKYRQAMGIAARSVTIAFTATEASILDPNDPLCLDIVGFDSAGPKILSDFSRGLI